MNAFIEKFGPNATLVVRAFAIAKRNNRQLQARELTILSEAVDVIVPHLAGTSGMTSIEFEVLMFHGAVINPEETLDFLNSAVEIIKATRPEGWFTEYDTWFLMFVSQLHDTLLAARQAHQGENSAPVSFAADPTLQASAPVFTLNNGFQAWPSNNSQMVSPDASILTESGAASYQSIFSSLLPATEHSAPQTMGFRPNTIFPQSSYLDSIGLAQTQGPDSIGGSQNANHPDWLVNFPDYDLEVLIAMISEMEQDCGVW
ncbi:hypothetical protein ACHAP5_012104 [Fusarium lateritium]